ncbi:MAG: EpsG family protein [Paludibacteraceae bacterium]|nr:EpsG family protein [Paludibacteraceae bacterium]
MMAFAILESFCFRWPNLCRQLSRIQFAVLVILVVAKYALGPDIIVYLPQFRLIEPLSSLFQHPFQTDREPAWCWFISICANCGMTFWMMTAFISLLYYGAVFCLWRKVRFAPCMVLFLLTLLDYNLVLYELRQCLAVSFFLYTIILLMGEKKHYFWAVCLLVLCALSHKSGIFMVVLTGMAYGLYHIRVDYRSYFLLLSLLIGLAILPAIAFTPIINLLPDSIAGSLALHVSAHQMIQTVAPIYFLGILLIGYHAHFEEENKKWHWMIWCALAIIACLYAYWFLLNRLRSYFILFILVYGAHILHTSERKNVLPRQFFSLILYLYAGLFIYTNITIPVHSKTNAVSTVFERKHLSQSELEERQMKEAIKYWKEDYPNLRKKGIK